MGRAAGTAVTKGAAQIEGDDGPPQEEQTESDCGKRGERSNGGEGVSTLPSLSLTSRRANRVRLWQKRRTIKWRRRSLNFAFPFSHQKKSKQSPTVAKEENDQMEAKESQLCLPFLS